MIAIRSRRRCLDLIQLLSSARTVGVVETFGDDTLQAYLQCGLHKALADREGAGHASDLTGELVAKLVEQLAPLLIGQRAHGLTVEVKDVEDLKDQCTPGSPGTRRSSFKSSDVLHLDGQPVRTLPYRQRRELLDELGDEFPVRSLRAKGSVRTG